MSAEQTLDAAGVDRFRPFRVGKIDAGAASLLDMPGTMASSLVHYAAAPHDGEPAGNAMILSPNAEFEAMVARGEFLEYARVFGKHSYGTPKKWLDESRKPAGWIWFWKLMYRVLRR